MGTAENKEIVRRAHDAFTSGDSAALEQALAPHCVLHQCGFLNPVVGADTICQLSSRAEGAFSERKREIVSLVAEGDQVAFRTTTTGRHTGEQIFGDPTGRVVRFDTMMFMRLEEDKIVEIWNVQDTASILSQLNDRPEGPGT